MDEGAHQRSTSGQAHWLTNDTPKETPLKLVREEEDHDDDENLGELKENSPQSSVLRRQQEDERKLLASQGEDIFMMQNEDSLEGRRDSAFIDNGKVFSHRDSNNEVGYDADTRRSSRMYSVYDEDNDGYAYNHNYKRRSGDENGSSRAIHAAGSQVQRANRDTSSRQTPTSVTQSKARSSSLRGAYYALVQQPLSKASVPATHSDQPQSGYASALSSARSNATPTSSYASHRYTPAPSTPTTTRSHASEKTVLERGRPYSTPHRPLSPTSVRTAAGPRASYSHPQSMRGGNSPVSTHHLPRRQSPSTRNKRPVMGQMRGNDATVAVAPQHRARAGHTTVTTRSDPTNFSNRLQALMVVRDRMEHLAATHRQEEAALREMLQDLFHKEDTADAIGSNRSGREVIAIPPRPNPPRELLEANSLLKKQLDEYSKKCEDIDSKLRDAVNERDKAINLLENFQEEGSRVIESLHSSVKKANQENVKMLQQNESSMQENARLKEIIKRLSRRKTQTCGESEIKVDDLVPGTTESGDEQQEVVGEKDHISIDFHEEVVQDYQVLLGEADDVITSLRTVNEDLKRDVANLTARVKSYAGNDSKGDENSSDNTDNELRHQKIENIIHELRAEKLQRLQAEEHAHELSAQHQKHTSLLEQRILHLTKLLYGGRGDRGSSSSASSSSVASFSYRGHLNYFTPSSPLPLRAGAPNEIASERSSSSQRHPLVSGLSLSGVHTGGVGSALETSRTDQNDVFSPSPGRTPRQEVNWSFVYQKRANQGANICANSSGRQCAMASPRGRDEVHTPLTIGEVSTVTSTQFSVVQCPSEKGHLCSHTTADAISPVDPSRSGHTSPVSVAGAGSEEAFHQLSPFQLRRLHRDQALARKAYHAPDTSSAAQTVPRLSSTSGNLKESAELSDPDVCEYSGAIQSESQLLRLAEEVDDGDQSSKQSLSPHPEQRPEDAALAETTNYSSVRAKSPNTFRIAKVDLCGDTDPSRPRVKTCGDDALDNEPVELLVSEADEISADLF